MRKLLVPGALLVIAILLGATAEFSTGQAGASSHREAPLISQDPVADNTDVYMFRSPEDDSTVTLIANYYPYQGPAGGPNFYRFGDDVRYEFNIDNNGDARPDIRYFFTFSTVILNNNTFLYNTGPIDSITSNSLTVRQAMTVWKDQGGQTKKLAAGLVLTPSNVGCHSFQTGWSPQIPASNCGNGIGGYENIAQTTAYTLPNGEGRVFAGQRRDSFFADVGAIFDLLSIRQSFATGGYNLFDQFSVQTIALQVPIDKLTNGSEPVLGFFATNSRLPTRVIPNANGKTASPKIETEAQVNNKDWKRVSRLGLALINEAVIPMALKDKFNASGPKADAANFGAYVVNPELANLLNGIYGLPIPPTPRNDLVENLLLGIPGVNRPLGNPTAGDILRLNTTTPVCTSGCSPYGVIAGDAQGYPNGRRLGDDVVDISERVIAGGYILAPTCNTGAPGPWCGGANAALGDGVNGPPYAFGGSFPYLASPLDGFSYVPSP
jgi:hypothetical protein